MYIFADFILVDLDLNSRSPEVTKSSNSGFYIDNLKTIRCNCTKIDAGVYLNICFY